MSAAPTRREAPLAAALASLLLLSSAPAASATESYGARRTVYYQDTACRLESFREYAYNARSMEVDHTSRQVDFGKCYARGSTGAITTCDPTDGTSTIETYLDTECQQHLYSSRESPECQNLRVDGHSCPAGGPSSSTSDCTSMSPYPTITPGAFNLVGSPYTDRMCEHRAGGDHIVPGGAFGVGNIECSLSTLVRGKLFSLSECMEDGTVYAKVFGPDDINCSGELYNEVLMFPRAAQTDMTGGMCALGIFEDGRREYYRLKACTTKAETPKEPITVTPAPTAHADMVFVDDDQTNGQPAPVDYRGDGDDEDLRDGIDDDDGSSSYHDSRDGKGHSSSDDKDSGDGHPHGKEHDDDCGHEHDEDDDSLTGSMAHGWRSGDSSDDDSGDRHHHHHRDDSSSGDDASGDDYHHHHSSDDDHHDSHHHGDSDDDDVHSSYGDGSSMEEGGSRYGSSSDDGHGHGDGGSDDGGDGRGEEEDDDLDANASGRGGGVDGDGDDGLTRNGVLAIVFGVAVAFAICLLSFLLATAGDNRQKVGPKT